LSPYVPEDLPVSDLDLASLVPRRACPVLPRRRLSARL